MSRKRVVAIVGLAAVAVSLALAVPPARRLWRAGTMLSELARPSLAVENISLATRAGPVRARIYHRPDQAHGPGVVVVHGVHREGIDEHRMVPFARELAQAGLVVLTPEIADLADYRITAAGVSIIEDAALYLGGRQDLVDSARVGLLGFSFAGGLALVAAEDPRLGGRLAFVTSVGGHHDLARVLHFLVRNQIETPGGVVHKQAHDYGLIVLLYGSIDRFAPEADRPALREALRAWLREDRDGARAAAGRLSTEEGQALWARVENGRLQELAGAFESALDARRAELAQLSPRGRLRAIGAPVYLLAGSGDTVIPPSEAEWAAAELGPADHALLVSPLLEHVEVNHAAGLTDELAMVRFIARML
jgi:dienelactone hydrolase